MDDYDAYDSLDDRSDLSMEDEDILRVMRIRMNQALTVAQWWRDSEVADNYDVYTGDQWTTEDIERQNSNAQPIMTINVVKPTLDSIHGMAIQTNPSMKFIPRLTNQREEGFSDIMNHLAPYIEQNADASMAYAYAFLDMLQCGVGAVETYFSYDTPPHNGNVCVKRVFPGFTFWDPGARAKNILDANWCVVTRVTDKKTISDKYNIEYFQGLDAVQLDARILQFFSTILAVKDLGVVYEYQWRKLEPIWRVQNPFKEMGPDEAMQAAMDRGIYDMQGIETFVQMLMAQGEFYGQKFNFNPQLDAMFTIEDTKDYTNFKQAMDFYGLKTKKVEQKRYKYYKAIVVGDTVVQKSESFSQTGFTIKFMTDQFSETTQNYYGPMRAAKPIQRMLNQAVSDYQGFLQSTPKGGVMAELTSVPDMEVFINTYAKAKLVKVVNDGSISGQRIMPMPATPLPSGMLEMIEYAHQQIMQVCGVTAEMMGMMQTKEQNSGFLKQQLRQAYITQASRFDARRLFLIEQGRLYVDCARVLVENSEGIMIRDVIGDSDMEEIPLLASSIAPNYDVIIEEMPATPDEKQSNFEKGIELQAMLNQGPNPINIMPWIMENAPFDQKATKKIKELMKPPAPPEPDPMQQAILQGEIEYKKASAEKLRAEAAQIMHNLQIGKLQTDQEYVEAKTFTEFKRGAALGHGEDTKRLDTVLKHHRDREKLQNPRPQA